MQETRQRQRHAVEAAADPGRRAGQRIVGGRGPEIADQAAHAAHDAPDVADHLAGVERRPCGHRHRVAQPGGGLADRVTDHARHAAGRGTRRTQRRMPWHTHRFGAVRLSEGVEHGEGSDPVHDGMMDLEEAGGAAVLQSLDQIRFPERPQRVERRGEHGADEVQQVPLGGRLRQDHLARVVLGLEIRIVLPLRKRQPKRRLDDALAHPRQARDPALDGRAQAVVIRTTVQHQQTGHERTQLRRRRLRIPEQRVRGLHPRAEMQWVVQLRCRSHRRPPTPLGCIRRAKGGWTGVPCTATAKVPLAANRVPGILSAMRSRRRVGRAGVGDRGW